MTKYFGCELGAQTQFDIKAERYIVNGCHDAGKMQDMLDGFIKKFVLCEKCENPETSFKILEKKGTIKSTCAACGHSFMIDMRHKLTTYIIKVQTLHHGKRTHRLYHDLGGKMLSPLCTKSLKCWCQIAMPVSH